MSTLRLAKQVSGATNFKVAHRNLEATAEFGGLANCAQTFVGIFGENFVLWIKEIGIGALSTSPDTATKLVHLSKT